MRASAYCEQSACDDVGDHVEYKHSWISIGEKKVNFRRFECRDAEWPLPECHTYQERYTCTGRVDPKTGVAMPCPILKWGEPVPNCGDLAHTGQTPVLLCVTDYWPPPVHFHIEEFDDWGDNEITDIDINVRQLMDMWQSGCTEWSNERCQVTSTGNSAWKSDKGSFRLVASVERTD